MITCNLAGGLGNQLFMIATTTALALENNDTTIFDFDGIYPHKSPDDYKDTIFRKLNIGKMNILNEYQEPNFHFSPIPYVNKLRLNGYFQSEKYFKQYRTEILELFKPTDEILTYLRTKYEFLLHYETISVHIRRGDYLKYPDHHLILDTDYYLKSMSHFSNDNFFLIFSDDIEYCKIMFENDNKFSKFKKVYITEDDVKELYLMSLCDHNVISASTFGWWGSWLNENPNKKVIFPSTWFGKAYKELDTKDLIPEEWLKII